MRARWWCPLGGALVAIVLWCSPGTAAAQSCLIELEGVGGAVQFDGLAPGDARAWWTTVRNVSGEPVDLSVTVAAGGPLRHALVVDLHGCDRPWDGVAGSDIVCSGDTSDLVEAASLGGAAPAAELGRLDPDAAWHGRFTVTMRSSAGDEFQAAAGTVAATFTAAGADSVCTTPPEPPPPDPTAPTTTPPTTTAPPPSTPGSGPGDDGAPGGSGLSGPRGPRGPRGERGSPAPPAGERSGPLAWTGADLAGPGAVGVGLLAIGTILRSRRRPAPWVSERTRRDPGAGPPTS